MKLIAVMACLVSSLAFGNVIVRKYEGQVFSKENIKECDLEYDRITKMLDGIEGFVVLDGNCFDYGQKSVRLKFNYEAPIAKDLESFDFKFKTETACTAQARLGEIAVNNSKNLFVSSYCNGKHYYLDFIDQNYTLVRRLDLDANFSTKMACESENTAIVKALAKYKMDSLLSYCQSYKTMDSSEYFKLQLFYISKYDTDMKVLKGNQAQGRCLDQGVLIERNFSEANVELAHKFCSDAGKYSPAREYLLYVNKTRGFESMVKTYKAAVYGDAQTCGAQLSSLEAKFATLKRKVVYSYCEEVSETKFIPYLHFVQMK